MVVKLANVLEIGVNASPLDALHFCKCEAGLNCKNPLTKRVTGVDEEDEDIDLETLTD